MFNSMLIMQELLLKDGFTTMDAVALLEKEDLGPNFPGASTD